MRIDGQTGTAKLIGTFLQLSMRTRQKLIYLLSRQELVFIISKNGLHPLYEYTVIAYRSALWHVDVSEGNAWSFVGSFKKKVTAILCGN